MISASKSGSGVTVAPGSGVGLGVLKASDAGSVGSGVFNQGISISIGKLSQPVTSSITNKTATSQPRERMLWLRLNFVGFIQLIVKHLSEIAYSLYFDHLA